MNDLAIPTPEKGWDRSGKSRKTRSRLEKLRPGSAAPQRNALRDWHSVTRRTEKGHSVPALWTPRTFYFLGGIFVVFFFFPLRKVRSWHKKKKKVLAVHHAQVQRRGNSVQEKKPPGSGVYLQLVWAGLSDALLLWESLCSICRWQVKHKEKPSLEIAILTPRRACSKQPTSQAWQTLGKFLISKGLASSGMGLWISGVSALLEKRLGEKSGSSPREK